METIIPLLIGVVAVYFFISGLIRIFRRRARKYRWRYERPNWAVREQDEITGLKAVFRGFVRLAISGILFYLIFLITRS